MTHADRDLHDTPSPAVLEQITRWAVVDGWGGRAASDYAAGAVYQAVEGTPDHFRAALANLAEHDGPGSRAAMLQATLWGNSDAVGSALAGNEGLRALYRTAAQRHNGHDVAEIATPNGLRLRAEHTGEAYQTAVLIEDTPGRSDVLTSGTVHAATASKALQITAEREQAAHGLDQYDIDLISQQVARLQRLIAADDTPSRPAEGVVQTYVPDPDLDPAELAKVFAAAHERSAHPAIPDDLDRLRGRLDALRAAGPGERTNDASGTRHADPGEDSAAMRRVEQAAAVTGRDFRHDPAVATLADTLTRAEAAGWSIAGNLPDLVAQQQLSDTHPAQDVAYRVMDACPDAVPPAPSTARINGVESSSTGRQRAAAEHAITRPPAIDRAPTVGR